MRPNVSLFPAVSYSVINIYVLSGCILQGLCGLLFPSNFAFYLTENILIQSFCFTNSLFSCSAVINARVSRFFCSSSMFLIRLQRFRHERTRLRRRADSTVTAGGHRCVDHDCSGLCTQLFQPWLSNCSSEVDSDF